MKYNIKESEPPINEAITLISRYGVCFTGRYAGDSQFKVTTRYLLSEDGNFTQLVITMHISYFDYWISHE